MKYLLSILLLSLSACATASGKTDTPAVTAGKSLYAIQQVIVETRDKIGVPCQKGAIPHDACIQMDALYQQAKPAYDAAVNAEILALRGGSGADTRQTRDALIALEAQLLGLALKYTGGN